MVIVDRFINSLPSKVAVWCLNLCQFIQILYMHCCCVDWRRWWREVSWSCICLAARHAGCRGLEHGSVLLLVHWAVLVSLQTLSPMCR